MLLQSAAAEAIPAAAIRDTVTAIAAQAEYHRSVRESIIGRVWRYLWEQLSRLLDSIGQLPHGRTIAIAIVVFVVILIVARIVYASRLGLDELESSADGSGATRRFTVTEADRLAVTGDYIGALRALYRAVLETLAVREGLRLHSSKTSGDYVRDLRMNGSPSAGPFRQFARLHDRIVYGSGECNREDWERARAQFDLLRAPERAA